MKVPWGTEGVYGLRTVSFQDYVELASGRRCSQCNPFPPQTRSPPKEKVLFAEKKSRNSVKTRRIKGGKGSAICARHGSIFCQS